MTDPITTEKLLHDLHTLVRDAEALLKATVAQPGEQIQAVRERVEASLHQAKERLADAQEAAVKHFGAAAEATEDYVKKNPWQSLGLAAAIGLVLGALLRKRNN